MKLKAKSRARKGNKGFNLALLALSVVGIVAVELVIAGTISEINPTVVKAYGLTIPLAVPQAVLSVVLGLLGAMASAAATQARLDPRPEQRARAKGLRAVSFGCIIVPLLLLAQALTWPLQVSAHRDYVGTVEKPGTLYVSDKSILADEMADPRLVVQAQDRINRLEAAPSRPQIDFWMFWEALIIYVLIALAPGFLTRPAAETEAEARRRIEAEQAAAEAARKAEIEAKKAATRAENKKAKEKADRKAQRSNGGIVLPFGRAKA